MPWEDENNIEKQILGTRYVIWDDMVQEYRPRWTSKQDCTTIMRLRIFSGETSGKLGSSHIRIAKRMMKLFCIRF